MTQSRKTIVKISIAVAIVTALTFIYFNYDPSKSSFFPRCITLQLTGYRCPGCGSQRAIHSLLHGNLAAAWRYNAFMVVAIPVMIIYGVTDIMRARWRRFHAIISNSWVLLTIFFLIVAWWILRNVFGWYVP